MIIPHLNSLTKSSSLSQAETRFVLVVWERKYLLIPNFRRILVFHAVHMEIVTLREQCGISLDVAAIMTKLPLQ
jgi:hypothetical protein